MKKILLSVCVLFAASAIAFGLTAITGNNQSDQVDALVSGHNEMVTNGDVDNITVSDRFPLLLSQAETNYCVQAGLVTTTTGTTYVAFGTAFASTPVYVLVSYKAAPAIATNATALYAATATSNGVNVTAQTNFSWIAIGPK